MKLTSKDAIGLLMLWAMFIGALIIDVFVMYGAINVSLWYLLFFIIGVPINIVVYIIIRDVIKQDEVSPGETKK